MQSEPFAAQPSGGRIPAQLLPPLQLVNRLS